MPVTAPTGPLATEHLAPTTLEELNTSFNTNIYSVFLF